MLIRCALLQTLPLCLGFLLDALIGDPHSFPHIVKGMGRLICVLEARIRAFLPKTSKGERLGGGMLVLAVLLASAALPYLLLRLCDAVSVFLGLAARTLLCFECVAAGSLRRESMRVYHDLKKNGLAAARVSVGRIVGRDTGELDEAGVLKAAVETIAENASDGVVAPMLYLWLFGAIGGCCYKAVNTMDSMLGYKNARYADFGFCAAKLDDAANFLPSRLCALMLLLSSWLLGMDAERARLVYKRDRRKHASPNSAQTEAVCAGALGIRLGGGASYFGVWHDKPFLGDATRPIGRLDIPRANRLMYSAALLTLLLFLLCTLIWRAGVLYEF